MKLLSFLTFPFTLFKKVFFLLTETLKNLSGTNSNINFCGWIFRIVKTEPGGEQKSLQASIMQDGWHTYTLLWLCWWPLLIHGTVWVLSDYTLNMHPTGRSALINVLHTKGADGMTLLALINLLGMPYGKNSFPFNWNYLGKWKDNPWDYIKLPN